MTENGRFSHGPELIQGGMGVGISGWKLAREVALAGERLNKPVLGVVSGVALNVSMIHKLKNGDLDELRALKAFPITKIAEKIIDTYWKKRDNSRKSTYPLKPEVLINGSEQNKIWLKQLIVAANFAEVWLAKEGHNNPIGINYLEKVQVPRLPEILGAMMAGVDYVLMGAGIPNQVPGVLDRFAEKKSAEYRISVTGKEGPEQHTMSFDPAEIIPAESMQNLKRPKFLAIISSHALAELLIGPRTNGVVNGFIVEGPTAGGHNAPARGKQIGENGEPIYGPKDVPNLGKILKPGKPVYLAGGYASAEKLREAKEMGATGIQVGSIFALANESGMRNDIKKELRRRGFTGNLEVLASPTTSPSGFPFQVAQLEASLSNPTVYEGRERKCNYGVLVEPYIISGERIGFRCPAEPVRAFAAKGGEKGKTEGRNCICEGLCATGNFADTPDTPYIATLGKEFGFLKDLMEDPQDSYSAEDVIKYIFG